MIGGFMAWVRSVTTGEGHGHAPIPNDPRIDMLDKIERENYARLEMLGINRQVLEERIEAEVQTSKRARKDHYSA